MFGDARFVSLWKTGAHQNVRLAIPVYVQVACWACL